MAKEEYELMPLGPLRELKREVQKLKAELKSDDGTAKILAKVLNSNIEIQKKVEAMLKEVQRANDNLRNTAAILESIASEEDEEVSVLAEVRTVKEQNAEIAKQLGELNEEIRRHTYFKERLPRGLYVAYQRTR